jgi:guanyl-specific ribonuclease Sa
MPQPKIDFDTRESKYDEGHKHYYPSRIQPNNGVTIWTLSYSSLSYNAREVIAQIRYDRVNPGGHKRDGTTFMNKEGYLPNDGEYYEYSSSDGRENDPGACVIIFDRGNERFYYTATHYRPFWASNYKRNPFYRVKDIPWTKDGYDK